jgi:hypothetical protein
VASHTKIGPANRDCSEREPLSAQIPVVVYLSGSGLPLVVRISLVAELTLVTEVTLLAEPILAAGDTLFNGSFFSTEMVAITGMGWAAGVILVIRESLAVEVGSVTRISLGAGMGLGIRKGPAFEVGSAIEMGLAAGMVPVTAVSLSTGMALISAVVLLAVISQLL